MLGNINGVSLMGADGDLGASTINVKTLMAAPWEVPELEI
jgi:hypothetical protein